MNKLKTLVADDERHYRGITISWLTNLTLIEYFDPYIECKYIKEQVPNEKNFDTILEELTYLDIALIDLQWIEDGFEKALAGGLYIIEKIEKKFPGCLIIPVTKFRHTVEETSEIFIESFNKRYKALPKDDTDEKRTERFLSYLEGWLISEIKNIRDVRQVINILRGLESGDKNDYMIEFNGAFRPVSSFILPEINFQGKTYFMKQEIASEIKKRISYPKNTLWGDHNKWGKHTEVYFKSLELDEIRSHGKIDKLEARAINYISNLAEILKLKIKKNDNAELINNAQQDGLICHQCKFTQNPQELKNIKDIPDEYFDNLLIRYIIIGICKLADKTHNQEWKNKYKLVELFYGSAITESTIKNFFYYAGFSLSGSSVYHASYNDDIFYKEYEFFASTAFNNIQI